jgi:perosamine synthetase
VAGAFYSAQWSKPVSAGLGGIAVARDPAVARELRRIEAGAPAPPSTTAITLEILRRGRELADHRIGFARLRETYHALTRLGLGPPSSDDAELTAPTMPAGYLRRMAPMQARALLRALDHLEADTVHRRAVAARYDAALAELGLPVPAVPAYAQHAYLRYPLLTTDRAAFLAEARRASLQIGDWFVSPLHPITERLERWGYQPGSCPVGDRVAATVVNLPTGPETGPREVDRVIAFVRDHADLVAPSATARIGAATAG